MSGDFDKFSESQQGLFELTQPPMVATGSSTLNKVSQLFSGHITT